MTDNVPRVVVSERFVPRDVTACWAGVDVGGHRKGFHLAVVDGQRLLHLERLAEPGAVVAVLLKWAPCVVSVDSPRRPAPDGRRSREEEQHLKQRVCGIRYTPDRQRLEGNPRYYEWIRRGFALYTALEEKGFVVIECFPTASFTRWAGPRGNTRRSRWTREALNQRGPGNLPPRLNQDQRDAIAAAMTAYAYERCRTENFGDIVVPRAEDSTVR